MIINYPYYSNLFLKLVNIMKFKINFILKMNNNIYNYDNNNNKYIFDCKGTDFNGFQKDLMGYITNYLDQYNKRKFFEINVRLKI